MLNILQASTQKKDANVGVKINKCEIQNEFSGTDYFQRQIKMKCTPSCETKQGR